MNLHDLDQKLSGSTKPITALVQKTDSSKVIAIGLAEGVKLKEHKAPGPSKILVLKGEIEYKAKTRSLSLGRNDEMDIPLEETHSVIGRSDTIFLLMIDLSNKE